MEIAKKRQQNADDEMRFLNYVNSQKNSLVSTLSEKWKREIVSLVVKKKKSAAEDKAQTQ